MAPAITRFGALQDRIAQAGSRRDLDGDPAYREALWSALDCVVRSPEDVLSLDIFDTLLLRDDTSELRRQWACGHAMAAIVRAQAPSARIGADGADAFLLRHLGTRATYRAAHSVDGCREGCLDEIHAVAARGVAGAGSELADQLRSAFVAAELGYEAERLHPARAILDYAARHRAAGGTVILLTDMYMRESHVRALLALLGVDPGLFELILSSADTKVSKASGGIFPLAELALGRDADAFVHVGDNPDGDFRNPIRHGWRAVHLPIALAERRRRRIDHIALSDEIQALHGFTPDVALPS